MAPAQPRVAASVRLILAMFRLYGNLEAGFGKAVLDILKAQYPESVSEIESTVTPSQIGRQLVQKAKKEVQNDEQAAYDVVQDWLVKVTNAKTDFRGDKLNDDGSVKSKGAKDWRTALNNILNNIRMQGINTSQRKYRDVTSDEDKYAGLLYFKQKYEENEGKRARGGFKWNPDKEKELAFLAKKLKDSGIDPSTIEPKRPSRDGQRTRTLDEAFGKSDGEGGDPTGGEGNVPTGGGIGGGGALGKPLDEKAALREFYDLLDEHVPDLKKTLSEETLPLFMLVYDLDIGGFGSDIKDNMGQASELKNLLTSGEVEMREETVEDPETKKKVKQEVPGTGRKVPGYPTEASKAQYEGNSKRWTGYVGDLRKKLLEEIWSYLDRYMSQGEYNVLKDMFFADADPAAVRKVEKDKAKEQKGYQRGIDERKVARIKWELENGQPKRAKDLEQLTKKFGEEELSKIQPKPNPGAASDEDRYAHLLSVVNDLEAKDKATKSDPSASKGAKERSGSALFKAKKDLKPVADKLIAELGKKVVDGIPASEDPEGSAKTTKQLREKRMSSALSVAMRVAFH